VTTAALGLALLAAPLAAAHVTVSPEAIQAGTTATLAFQSPNEGTGAPVTGLRLVLPAGLAVDQLEVAPGWSASVRGRTVTWSGGRIPPGQFAVFSLVVTASAGTGTLAIEARQTFADGTSAEWRPALSVTEAAPAGAAGRDAGARSLGKAALAVAIAAAGFAVLACFLGLFLWLRRDSGDQASRSTS